MATNCVAESNCRYSRFRFDRISANSPRFKSLPLGMMNLVTLAYLASCGEKQNQSEMVAVENRCDGGER